MLHPKPTIHAQWCQLNYIKSPFQVSVSVFTCIRKTRPQKLVRCLGIRTRSKPRISGAKTKSITRKLFPTFSHSRNSYPTQSYRIVRARVCKSKKRKANHRVRTTKQRNNLLSVKSIKYKWRVKVKSTFVFL